MAITKEEVREITEEAISLCRREVDQELMRLHKQDLDNAWTEERAELLANRAADRAVDKITNNFYTSVGKKTVAAIGATVVVMVIFLQDEAKHWLTMFRGK